MPLGVDPTAVKSRAHLPEDYNKNPLQVMAPVKSFLEITADTPIDVENINVIMFNTAVNVYFDSEPVIYTDYPAHTPLGIPGDAATLTVSVDCVAIYM
jgi:hypothetical protein